MNLGLQHWNSIERPPIQSEIVAQAQRHTYEGPKPSLTNFQGLTVRPMCELIFGSAKRIVPVAEVQLPRLRVSMKHARKLTANLQLERVVRSLHPAPIPHKDLHLDDDVACCHAFINFSSAQFLGLESLQDSLPINYQHSGISQFPGE